MLGNQLIADNTKRLAGLGLANPTAGQIYVMNWMGTGGGPALIKAAAATPDADATTMFPTQAAANPIFKGKTVGQVYAAMQKMADDKAAAYADQKGGTNSETQGAGQPAPCDQQANASASGGKSAGGSGGTSGTGRDGTTRSNGKGTTGGTVYWFGSRASGWIECIGDGSVVTSAWANARSNDHGMVRRYHLSFGGSSRTATVGRWQSQCCHVLGQLWHPRNRCTTRE